MHAGSRCRIYAMHSTTMKVFPPFHVTCTIKSHGSVGRGPILPIVIHLEAMQLNLHSTTMKGLPPLHATCIILSHRSVRRCPILPILRQLKAMHLNLHFVKARGVRAGQGVPRKLIFPKICKNAFPLKGRNCMKRKEKL
jgi:hypothetical protein